MTSTAPVANSLLCRDVDEDSDLLGTTEQALDDRYGRAIPLKPSAQRPWHWNAWSNWRRRSSRWRSSCQPSGSLE